MEPKKTKLDYFIESYSAYGLEKEATQVVASHVQFLVATGKLNEAIKKHTLENPGVDIREKVSVLVGIKAKKQTTLTSRKAKLKAAYKNKLACTVACGLVLKINGILNAFELASSNLTFKPTRTFFDTLADVRETLSNYSFKKRETWDSFVIPDSPLMLSVQSTPIISWLLSDSYKHVELCFTALAKFKKSSQADDVIAFGTLIGKLKTSLCRRLYDDLNGALVTSANQVPEPNWLDTVKITDLIQGEYVSVPIGSEDKPVAMLNAREEVARELAETDTRLAYVLESEECRSGIFAHIKAMTKELESGLSSATDKVDFLISFFNMNRCLYLQAYLDGAIAKAVLGKGNTDKKHLSDLNSLLASYSVIASPNNGEAKNVGVMGASELVHYVKFCCPWLAYKANDGGWYESAKWEGLSTVHKGQGFPVTGNDTICLYPPITLSRYLTVKKTIQLQVRITNRARKRHNDALKPSK